MDGNRALETIKGTVEGVVFHSDATDYTVLELSCDGVLITAVGESPRCARAKYSSL